MSTPHVSQAKDESSSQESEPPKRPDKLIPLIELDSLFNFRLDVGGEKKDIYEDVLDALREGRDYEDWAWWPYLIFPIPEEWYPTDEPDPDPTRKGEFIKTNRNYPPHMMELLQDAKWGTRLGYAVKLLDKLGVSGITEIVKGGHGKEFQERRMFHVGRFLFTYKSVLAIPVYEENQEAREICLRLLEGSWVDNKELVKRFEGDVWGDVEDLSTDEVIEPVEFENRKGSLSRGEQGRTSYFSQGMQRAADGLPLTSKPPVDEFVTSKDGLRERMGGKGHQFHFPSTLDENKRLSNHDDVPGPWKEVRADSYPAQHQRRLISTRDYRHVPSPSTSTRRESAPAPSNYNRDCDRYRYEEVHIPDRDRVSSSRHHYAHPTSTRERYRDEPSSSGPRRAQPAPASWGDVLPEHVREIADKYRDDHGLPKGEYHIPKHRR